MDIDKGKEGVEMIRSRWVARDFKVKGDKHRGDLFASMPPLEAKKAVFRIAATRIRAPPVKGRGRMKLLFIDVRKAHLNGVCDQEVYVELPKEAEVEGKCGRLKRRLYGMRPAAQAWPGLRGPGGEWEQGPTTVQGWATLDGGRI